MSIPSNEIPYSYPMDWTTVLQWQRNNKLACPVEYAGDVVACTQSGSTFTLYDPGQTAIVSAAAVTVGVDGIATYTVLAASLPSTVTLGEGWREKWTLVLPDGTRTIDRPAAVCRVPLYPVITDQDLIDEQTSILTHAGSAVTTFQPKITAAWKDILCDVAAGGWLSYTMKPASAFRKAHLYRTLGKVYRSFMSSNPRGNFKDLADHYDNLAAVAWSQLSVQLSTEKQEFVTNARARSGGFTVVHRNGAPSTFHPRGF